MIFNGKYSFILNNKIEFKGKILQFLLTIKNE